MTQDLYLGGLTSSANLAIGVAITTQVCRDAQHAHQLAPASMIGLGRLMTATALTSRLAGGTAMSLQVVCSGDIAQLFADIDDDGNLRGYAKNPKVELPLAPKVQPGGRHMIGVAVGRGDLSVIRIGEGREFYQSATRLIAGEIDHDVEYFMDTSVQIPTAMACDVLFAEDGSVRAAGGIMLQAMPGADPNDLRPYKSGFPGVDFPKLLLTHQHSPEKLLSAVFADAKPAAAGQPLVWKCRCSLDRVAAAFRMLDPSELAAMAAEGEDADVHCDLCGTSYQVPAARVRAVFEETIDAGGERGA